MFDVACWMFDVGYWMRILGGFRGSNSPDGRSCRESEVLGRFSPQQPTDWTTAAAAVGPDAGGAACFSSEQQRH
jgi:hypothetical protein